MRMGKTRISGPDLSNSKIHLMWRAFRPGLSLSFMAPHPLGKRGQAEPSILLLKELIQDGFKFQRAGRNR